MNKGLLKGYDITNWKFLKHRRQFFSLSIQNSRELLVLSFIQLLLLFLLFQSSAILAMLFCNECLRHWDNLQTKNHISWKQNQTLPPNTLSLEPVGPIKCEKIWKLWQCCFPMNVWDTETTYRLKTISVENKIKPCYHTLIQSFEWGSEIKTSFNKI